MIVFEAVFGVFQNPVKNFFRLFLGVGYALYALYVPVRVSVVGFERRGKNP